MRRAEQRGAHHAICDTGAETQVASGWKFEDDQAIELGHMAVRSRVFPLVEVEDGERWRFTLEPEPLEVESYIRAQGRFRHLRAEQISAIAEAVGHRYAGLKELCERSAG